MTFRVQPGATPCNTARNVAQPNSRMRRTNPPASMTDDVAQNSLLDRLAREFPTAKRQTLREMIRDRRVLVNDQRATRASQRIVADDRVRVLPRPSRRSELPASLAPLTLVFEDDDLLVIDKPAGLLTSTVAREKRPTALAIVRRYIATRDPKARDARVGLIHRLDRDAAGLLVFSKTHLAYESLKTQFFKHTVDRVYEAEVIGVPKPRAGRIESHLIERADGSVHSTDQPGKGQRAITDYETVRVDRATSRTILRVRLHTGRKHQIRVHLGERGWPIVGDEVYGKPSKDRRLRLKAVELALDHPRSGKRIHFHAPDQAH